jgi:acyl carrier protein
MDATAVRHLVATVLAGIAPEADLGRVPDDADLREALDLDSMDFMNFVVGLAARTGRDIAEAETPQLRTLRGLQAFFGG